MAKAVVKNPDITVWAERIARVVARTIAIAGWSHKEAAARIGVDDAELGKWLNATRRPHFDRLFAVKELSESLALGLATLDEGLEIVTVIRPRRSA